MRIALTDDGYVVDRSGEGWTALPTTGSHPRTLDELIGAVKAFQQADGDDPAPVDVDEAALRCPVVAPRNLIAIGLNYADHAREANVEPPDHPIAFTKLTGSLTDPFGPIRVDEALTTQCDSEVELAVVIGQPTRDVSAEDALKSVFAYTIANDVSARDWQFRDTQWMRAKSFDTFCPVGPWLVTADAVEDPQSLGIRCLVNGEALQDSTTAEMIFPVAELIAQLSQQTTLSAGDVILTGTPHGVGMARSPQRFLARGDKVRCEIDRLGAIENTVTAVG